MKDLLSNILLASVWAIFTVIQLHSFTTTGKVSTLLYTISQSLMVILFLLRNNKAYTVSTRLWDWVCALLGTFAPLFYVSTEGAQTFMGELLLITGICIQIAGILSLNKSLGIVPANRGLRTGGMYEIVRHPMYLGYILVYTGYLLENLLVWNLCVFFFAVILQLLRIGNEERFLIHDKAYRHYMNKVRWKLIPHIY
jgi:protein-S-isoprenylcysteine O-methyltransferase Ste14